MRQPDKARRLAAASTAALWLFVSPCSAASTGKKKKASLEAVAVSTAPAGFSFAEIDRLYFYRHQGENLKDSTELLRARLREAPDDADAIWRLGRNEVRWGERKETNKEKLAIFTHAEQVIGRAVELAPDNAEAHFWYGLALGRRGEARGILQSLFMIKPLKKRMRRVMELDDKHGGAHHVLGRMLFQLPALAGGSTEGAVRELLMALSLTPNFTAHYPALGEAYLKLGEKEKAAEILQKFYGVKTPADPAEYESDGKKVAALLKKLGQEAPSTQNQ